MKDLKTIVLVALPIAPVLDFLETYVFGDWQFVKWLLVLVVLDTIMGFVKHWIAKDVSSKAYGMIGKKLMIYSGLLILSHVLANFQIGGQVIESFKWFRYLACSAMMVREGISIIENSEAICPGLIPSGLIKRLKEFDSKTGDKIK